MYEYLSEELETRNKLIDIIRNKPGIHFRQIHRETDMAMGELEYHLNVLEKMEVISKRISSHYTRYYPADELSENDKKIMGILRQEKLREILLYIISSEGVGHGDIVKRFRLIKSTASFYLDKLLSKRIIEKKKRGRNVFYSVKDQKKVLRLILIYKEGFGDRIVKRVEGLWANL